MSFVPMPDYVSALIEHLRSQPEMVAVVGASRIITEIPSGSTMPTHNHLVVRKAGRGFSPPMHGAFSPRIDLVGFGTTPYEAMRIIRTAYGLLVPISGDSRFISRGVIFDSFTPDIEPVDSETEQGWPFVFQSYTAVIMRRLAEEAQA